jgi:hypothetical protein
MDHHAVRSFLRDVEAERDRYATLATSIRAILDGEMVESADSRQPETPGKKREARPPLPAIKRKPSALLPKPKESHLTTVKPPGSAKAGNRVIDRTIAALRKRGKPMGVLDIARAIEHPPQSLQQCLASYVKQGLIIHTGRAQFGLPEHVEKGNGKETPVGNGETASAPAFQPYHHVEKYRSGYRCSLCHEFGDDLDGFDKFCRGGAA